MFGFFLIMHFKKLDLAISDAFSLSQSEFSFLFWKEGNTNTGTSVFFAFPGGRNQKYLGARETRSIWVTISIWCFQRACVLSVSLWTYFHPGYNFAFCILLVAVSLPCLQSSCAVFPCLTLEAWTLHLYHILNIKTVSIPKSLVWADRQVNTKNTWTCTREQWYPISDYCDKLWSSCTSCLGTASVL